MDTECAPSSIHPAEKARQLRAPLLPPCPAWTACAERSSRPAMAEPGSLPPEGGALFPTAGEGTGAPPQVPVQPSFSFSFVPQQQQVDPSRPPDEVPAAWNTLCVRSPRPRDSHCVPSPTRCCAVRSPRRVAMGRPQSEGTWRRRPHERRRKRRRRKRGNAPGRSALCPRGRCLTPIPCRPTSCG